MEEEEEVDEDQLEEESDEELEPATAPGPAAAAQLAHDAPRLDWGARLGASCFVASIEPPPDILARSTQDP